MKNFDILLKFLSNLGISFEESQIYFTLVNQGPITVLEISRLTKISRTNVYRLVEHMAEKGLVEEQLKANKKLIVPAGPHKLELMVKEQESKADSLRKLMPELSEILATNESISQPGTKILMYRGSEGIKQMVWNTLKANKEVVGYTFRVLSEIVGKEFEELWRSEFIRKNLIFRDLISDAYTSSVVEHNEGDKYPRTNFQSKYIPPTVLNINHQCDIYNDVVSYYTWREDEIFGVEIYNKKIADTQKQLFNLAWEKAETLNTKV